MADHVHDKLGQLDRSICGGCDEPYWECSVCEVWFCDCTRTGFVTKASDTQDVFASGMTRDSNEGKARFDLLLPEALPYDQQMLTRFAMLMARGSTNHGDRNWEQAHTAEDLARFKESLHRHAMQYLCGDRSEDHAAAILYNVMGAEYVRYQLDSASNQTGQ